MRKTLWFPLISTVGTMTLLYWVGTALNLSYLKFSLALNEPLKEGLIFNANISILPIIIGLIAGFIVERFIKVKKSN